MTSYQLSIIWLIGLLPSYVFGLGGVATWTVLMWLINEYQDIIDPDRNGVRNSRKSKEGNKNYTVEELNYFDKHPGSYKAYWLDEYRMLEVKGSDYHYEYYRCKECGHVIKILIWNDDKSDYGFEILHWCRGCQKKSNLEKISQEIYDYENEYYNKILELMKYTKIGDINKLYDLIQRYLEGGNKNNWWERFCFQNGTRRCGLKKYYIRGAASDTVEEHYDIEDGIKYIYYNASDIETEGRYDDDFEKARHGYDLREIFIACMELKKYPFYNRIYVPRKMTVENYLKMKGQDLFLRFIDENGVYHPKDGYRVEDPKSIYLLQQIDAGVYEEGKYKG